MPVPLERILYGPTAQQTPGYGVSAGLAPQEALLWRGLASLDPLDSGDSYGLFSGPSDHSAFVRAGRTEGGQPIWEFLILPPSVLTSLGGDLGPLRALLDGPFAPLPVPPQIERAELPDPAPWPPDDQRAAVESLAAARGDRMSDVWALVGMALHERGLMIVGAPENGDERLRIVQGLAALLPASARPLLAFTGQRASHMPSNARIAYAARGTNTGRWTVDWPSTDSLPDLAPITPYLAFLRDRWTGDVDRLLAEVSHMDALTTRFADGRPLGALLNTAAERQALDQLVLLGEPVAPDTLRHAIRQMPPEAELTEPYMRRLLDHALQARDTDAALQVARAMDADPALDAALQPVLEQAIVEQPDAAYAFVRARVASADPTDPRWLARLARAAGAALRVALDEGDVEIVRNWLRLLAREPAAYGLSAVLHEGLQAALPLGREQPDLARTMLVVGAKRDPAAFNELLEDPAFTAGLPPDLRDLLCAGDCASLTAASSWGVELLLAALSRAAAARHATLFTPDVVDTLWSLAFGSQAIQVAEPFGAQTTVAALIADPAWLPSETTAALLMAALNGRQDALFQQAVRNQAAAPEWAELAEPVLISALRDVRRQPSEQVALLGGLASAGLVPEQTSLNVTVALLDEHAWSTGDLPLAVQAARGAQAGFALPDGTIVRLLDMARTTRDEAIARDSARRATADLEREPDDHAFAEAFARLTGLTRWNPPTSAAVLGWWRGFALSLPTARLARLDKAFDVQPELAEAREVAGSLIGLRRMLGKRTLEQFAVDAANALALLQSLDEAFETAARREGGFDAEIVRMDLNERVTGMSPTDIKLLANQLAAIAQLVGKLGDSRTRPALLRRDDADQQLAHGEAEPHSAVDALKWISGYLSGAHREEGN